MAPPRALVIGLDAFDREIADSLIDDGMLPNLAKLTADGCVADVENPYGMLTGPVWPTLVSGTSLTRHLNWTWRQLVPGTYRKRFRGANAPSRTNPFWESLDAGVSVLAVDVPRVGLGPARDRTRHIVGLGQHDIRDPRQFVTSPPELRDELLDDFHVYEDRCDALRADGRIDELSSILLEGIERKLELIERLDRDGFADLTFVVFPESHCAGHQFFGEHADRLIEIYQRLDAAVGRLVHRYGADTNVAVLMSHGMAAITPVSRLLPPVLEAIDDAMGRAPMRVRARSFAERLPNRLARAVLRATGRNIEPLDHWVDSSRRFFTISVFPTYGAVRLNLEGREPRGRVRPSDEQQVRSRLEHELLQLRDVDSGEPLVRLIEPVDHHHPSEVDIGLPDLIFEWAITDRVVRGARSETVGEVIVEPERFRPGNHLRDGRAIFTGPAFEPQRREPIKAEDVAPTIAASLGHVLDDVDGVAFVDPEWNASRSEM